MSAPEPVVERGVVAGNVYDKYRTKNPLARRLMDGFLAAFDELVERAGAREVHEVGCGEGELARRLAARGLRVRASDFSQQIIDAARRATRDAGLSGDAIELEVRDLYRLEPARDAAELVVCCEVLEHLEHPADALDVLATLARPHLLVSVPREPIWRLLNLLRGRYVGAWGNTPGHLQHWSRRGFLELLATRFEIVAVRSPLPWTMALCRVANRAAAHST